jgi:hypothetical protein
VNATKANTIPSSSTDATKANMNNSPNPSPVICGPDAITAAMATPDPSVAKASRARREMKEMREAKLQHKLDAIKAKSATKAPSSTATTAATNTTMPTTPPASQEKPTEPPTTSEATQEATQEEMPKAAGSMDNKEWSFEKAADWTLNQQQLKLTAGSEEEVAMPPPPPFAVARTVCKKTNLVHKHPGRAGKRQQH